MGFDIVPVDPRRSMDLYLELAFIMTAKTLLSRELCGQALPLRVELMFEDYMRLAGIVLNFPELSFQKSSTNLRQFARALQNRELLVLNDGTEGDLPAQIPGMVVLRVCHNFIDDMYPDEVVFGAFGTAQSVGSGADPPGVEDRYHSVD